MAFVELLLLKLAVIESASKPLIFAHCKYGTDDKLRRPVRTYELQPDYLYVSPW